MIYPDLSAYEYGDLAPPWTHAFNVGWLGPDDEVGSDVAPEFADALHRIVYAYEVNVTRGLHMCPFCGDDDGFWIQPVPGIPGSKHFLGHAEAHFEGPDGTVYAAPSLIAHYVGEHGYLPPQRFVDAVLWLDARTDYTAAVSR
ncbi:hypothetical protein L6E12_07510 [Actinokineospora sp. PR83]|uniref:DUF7919 family protein n=1 Tax=Actinokineospora sp. PR83 TaxID=2884908 RepID=UPI001F1B7F43|nr:hypothetical protein [Actinokineospora sp. PR83]MCG8915630.1 hypothetical protein [Actinokineospora sp. PR83]